MPNKNFFFKSYATDIFLFVTAIISLMVTTIVMYILCKHMKLKSLITSLASQQIKEISMVTKQEYVTSAQDIECTCKIQWYTILMLSLSILGLVIVIILKSRKLRLFRDHLFSNVIKMMLIISDMQYYSWVGLSFCCIIILRTLAFSLSQIITAVKDKLSCSTEHFIKSENNQTKLPLYSC